MKKILFLITAVLGFAQLQARHDFQFYNATPHKIKVEVYYQAGACKNRTGDIGLTLAPNRATGIGANGCNIRSIWTWAVDDQGAVKKNNKGEPLSLERKEVFAANQDWGFMISEINEVSTFGDQQAYKRLKIEAVQGQDWSNYYN